MITGRTTLLGRQREYQLRLETLKIEIDTAAKGIILHFEPLDQDLEYVKNIIPERLKVNVSTIERKMRELKKISIEIEVIERELGQG
jgi:hypothetical protein